MKKILNVMGFDICSDAFSGELFILTKTGYKPLGDDPMMEKIVTSKIGHQVIKPKIRKFNFLESFRGCDQYIYKPSNHRNERVVLLTYMEAAKHPDVEVRMNADTPTFCAKCGGSMGLHAVRTHGGKLMTWCPGNMIRVGVDGIPRVVTKERLKRYTLIR